MEQSFWVELVYHEMKSFVDGFLGEDEENAPYVCRLPGPYHRASHLAAARRTPSGPPKDSRPFPPVDKGRAPSKSHG